MTKVYLNGKIMAEGQARVLVNDRGLTLGDGLFETLRASKGEVLRLSAHLARLQAGADLLGIPVPKGLEAAIRDTLAANKQKDAVLRLTLTRGSAPRGVLPPDNPKPTVIVTIGPPPPVSVPLTTIIAKTTYRNEFSPLSRCKTLNYLDNVIARREAHRQGMDDAILLNTRDFLAETTVANLFLVKNGQVFTPKITDGALPGVMRAEVIKKTGAKQKSLSVADLLHADEAFTTNSLGVRQLITVWPRYVPKGPLGEQLAKDMI